MPEPWLALVIAGFVSGAVPYAILIGHIVLRKNIRQYGDGNPGATNVLRAGGIGWFLLAGLLDALKALIPVGLGYFILRVSGWPMVAIAMAPVVGHAFSPFLRFRGGKAVAATFGMLSGLTIWEGPTVFGLLLAFWAQTIVVSGWIVILAVLSTAVYFMLTNGSPLIITVLCSNILLMAWTHRKDLRQPPGLRQTFKRLVARLPWWRNARHTS
jgi:glycerol-3-phosphate acyltransferase PlsY